MLTIHRYGEVSISLMFFEVSGRIVEVNGLPAEETESSAAVTVSLRISLIQQKNRSGTRGLPSEGGAGLRQARNLEKNILLLSHIFFGSHLCSKPCPHSRQKTKFLQEPQNPSQEHPRAGGR